MERMQSSKSSLRRCPCVRSVTRAPALVEKRRSLAPLRATEAEAIDPSAIAAILGYVADAGFFTLWFVELKSKSGIGKCLLLGQLPRYGESRHHLAFYGC